MWAPRSAAMRGSLGKKGSLSSLSLCLLFLLAWTSTSPIFIVGAEEAVCTAGSEDGSCKAAESQSSNNKEKFSKVDGIVQWIQAMEGGSVAADKFTIERRLDYPRDNSKPKSASNFALKPEFDFYATQDIAKGEVLMEIPDSAMIGDFLTLEQDEILTKFMKKRDFDDNDDVYDLKRDDYKEFGEDLDSHDRRKRFIPMCLALEQIAKEKVKGAESSFYPYLEFVFGEGSMKGKKPAGWTHASQTLFWDMIGMDGTIYTPDKVEYDRDPDVSCQLHKILANRLKSVFDEDPVKTQNVPKAFRKQAYHYFTRHAWGTMLIPLFEMIPHRNGKWKNIEARFVDVETETPVAVRPRKQRFEGFLHKVEDEPHKQTPKKLVVYAHRDIAAGEPLRVSYNQCEHLGCESLKLQYTTANLMGDAGFLEDYPRRWSYEVDPSETEDPNYFMIFEIDIDPSSGEKKFSLLQNVRQDDELYILAFLSTSIDRWNKLKYKLLDHFESRNHETGREKYEYEAIWDFYNGYIESFHEAWLHRFDKVNSTEEQYTISGYDDLTKTVGRAMNSRGRYMVCGEGEIIDNGDAIGIDTDFYQQLDFFYEKNIDNTYITMNSWLHSASNFRAHYHDSMIHVPMQYIENPKRVVYMGGGDNMVLAELLKYESLELIVAFELDQQVTRSSMKYFGTSPVYHDERVEWWFGNAANTIQIIPEEYFGSFDLVIVDLLTEVAEAIKVAVDLNLADVAPLLMKPEGGVISRNEDQVDRSDAASRIGKYVVMYDYWDLPRLCEGSHNFVSNSVDFARDKRYDHGIDTLVRLKDFDNQAYDGWSNYHNSVKNSQPQGDEDGDTAKSTTTGWTTYDAKVCGKIERGLAAYEAQPHSGGMMLVIEAENVTVSLEPEDLPALHSKIDQIAKDHGLSVFETSYDAESDENSFILLFDEGYIKMQTYPEVKYVGFDLALWGVSSIVGKAGAIKKELIASVGGGKVEDSVSSYSFTTRGMSVAQEEEIRNSDSNRLVEKAREYYCGKGSNDSTDTDDNDSANKKEHLEKEDGSHKVQQVFEPSIIVNEIALGVLVSDPNRTEPLEFAIFCGKKNADDCSSYASVSSITTPDNDTDPYNTTFHQFYSCESFEDMASCESDITQRLYNVVSQRKRFDGFVLDSSVSLDMGKILHKVFNSTVNQANIFERSFAGMSPTSENSWRDILLDRFRTEIILARPLATTNFKISNGTHSEVWGVVSVRNERFFYDLEETFQTIEAKTSWDISTQKILSGINPLITDWNPYGPKDSDFYVPEVQDQWLNQKPLANQYLIQMSRKFVQVPLEVNETVLVGAEFIKEDSLHDDFLYELYEATITNKAGKYYKLRTKKHTTSSGRVVTFPKEKRKDMMVLRKEMRRFSKTDSDQKFDAGDIVMVRQRLDKGLGEAITTAWYTAIIIKETSMGFSVKPKDPDSDQPYQHGLAREDILPYAESTEFIKPHEGLITLEALEKTFEMTAHDAGLTDDDDAVIENFQIGMGHLVTFMSSKGSGVMRWDGSDNVEVNMLIEDKPDEIDFSEHIEEFKAIFKKNIPSLIITAMETFPRGYGKTVMFSHEKLWTRKDGRITDYIPHWMKDHVPEGFNAEPIEEYFIDDEDNYDEEYDYDEEDEEDEEEDEVEECDEDEDCDEDDDNDLINGGNRLNM